MEWEKRNKHAKAYEQRWENPITGEERSRLGQRVQFRYVERALINRDGEIDGDLPGGLLFFAGAPDADEKEGGDERQFVEGVEKKEVEREKCPNRTR